MSYSKLKAEEYGLLGGINTKVSLYNNQTKEFLELTNLNFVSVGALTKRPGTALYLGATIQGKITGGVEFTRLNGASYIIATANTNAYTVSSGFNSFRSGLLNNALFSFTPFVDRLFAANGQDFFKFDGSNSYNFSLPPGLTGAWGVTKTIGGGLSGTYVAAYGYLNERGYFGPPSNGITITLNGVTFGSITYYGLTTPSGFGVTAISLYRSSTDNTDLAGTTYLSSGATTGVDTGFPLTTRVAEYNLWFTLAPKYLELYNNQLFMAGFSSLPSTAFWSQIGEPEGVDPTFFNEFRTNDSDRITGMKSYAGSLIVSKLKSFHALSGDDPTNFVVQEISNQYGCVSHRAMVVYEQLLWFLDTKGIIEYNGANIKIVSNKVEGFFKKMNLSAAIDNAVALHVKQFNEVWFSFPYDGSSINNIILVYDYLADAWTKYEGVVPSSVWLAQSTFGILTPMYGGYTGNVSYFGSSLLSDNGAGITCFMDGTFLAPEAQTTEKQFRRFYLNIDPVSGPTQPIYINFKTNYTTAIAASFTIYQVPFQTRIDFGLSAKSIGMQMTYVSASLPLKINGYAFESRFQRNV